MNGKIIQVSGSVIDVAFEKGRLPKIKEALSVSVNNMTRMMEVAQHIGDNVVRCIAMSSTDGLQRGVTAVDTGAPISVRPVRSRSFLFL